MDVLVVWVEKDAGETEANFVSPLLNIDCEPVFFFGAQ